MHGRVLERQDYLVQNVSSAKAETQNKGQIKGEASVSRQGRTAATSALQKEEPSRPTYWAQVSSSLGGY